MSLHEIIRAVRPRGLGFMIKGRGFGFAFGNVPDRQALEDELRAIEAAGADPEVLAKALMDSFHTGFPAFRGLGAGFRRRDQLSPNDPLLGLWGLVVLRDGWRVLDHLGTSWSGLLIYLLGGWPPRDWMADFDLLRIPQLLRVAIQPEGLVFGTQETELDLSWLPQRLSGSLSVTGPIPHVRLPKALECWGPVHLEHLGGLRTLSGLTSRRNRLTLAGCEALEHIDLPIDTRLIVRGCPQLTTIAGKLSRDLTVEDCPSLDRLDIVFPRDALPAPKLTIRRCHRLKAIGRPSSVARTCGDLSLEDCEELSYLQPRLVIRGKKTVINSPRLGPLKSGW